MKYVTPKYENVLIEAKDVITSSTASNKYESEQKMKDQKYFLKISFLSMVTSSFRIVAI